MIFGMCTEKNREQLDFLKENNIFTVNTYAELTNRDILYIIKQDLRNTDIQLLVIDLSIFEEMARCSDGVIEALESLELLHPECRVILLTELDTEKELWKEKVNGKFEVTLWDRIEDVVKKILNEDDVKAIIEEEVIISNEIQDEELVVDIQIDEDTLVDVNQEQELSEQEEAANLCQGNIDLPKIDERNCTLDVDVYSKANNKVKMTDGKPLLSQKVQEQKQPKQMNIVKIDDLSEKKSYIQMKGNWDCSNVIIAMVGAGTRTGTTTASFQLAEYLSQSGAKVTYTEANHSCHLRSIINSSGEYIGEQNGTYQRKNICYFESAFDQDNGSNFIIFDMGNLQDNLDWKYRIINEMSELIVIVSGGKEYELPLLEKTVDMIKLEKIPFVVLMNFLSEPQYAKVKEKYSDIEMIKGEYEPELFQPFDCIGHLIEKYKS